MEHRICRLCETSDEVGSLVQYAARSYVHWKCYLNRKSLEDGLSWLRGLHSHQLRNAPVLIVQEWLDARGWEGVRSMELLLRILKEIESREAAR